MNKLEKKNQKLIRALNAGDLITAVDALIAVATLWNPAVGAVVATAMASVKIGVSVVSRRKAEIRIKQIAETILRIFENQKRGNTNFEAAIVCPDLFKSALIMTDSDRAKEHLLLIEYLFSSGNFDFDLISEAIRIVGNLTSNEYKLLKLIPRTDTKWQELLEIEEIRSYYEKDADGLEASLLSLQNQSLIVRKLAIRLNGGPELGSIDFNADIEYVRLSKYGKRFLDSLSEVAAAKESSDVRSIQEGSG